MEETIKQIVGWSAGGLACLATVLEVSKININPWSWLLRLMGRTINHDILTQVGDLQTSLNLLKDDIDKKSAKEARARILRFGDELRLNVPHSKDYYDSILVDIDTYELYCSTHPDFVNNMTKITVKLIKDSYESCMEKNNFL